MYNFWGALGGLRSSLDGPTSTSACCLRRHTDPPLVEAEGWLRCSVLVQGGIRWDEVVLPVEDYDAEL